VQGAHRQLDEGAHSILTRERLGQCYS